MRSAFKRLLRRVAPSFAQAIEGCLLAHHLRSSSCSYLRRNGFFEPHSDSLDAKDATPWMNYCVVDFLDNRLSPDHILFEYGSGSSTLYFARKVRRVVSVEHNQSWVHRLSGVLPENAEVILAEDDPEKYSLTVGGANTAFDIIIVDGIYRRECCRACVDHLHPSGVVLIDDSDLRQSKGCREFLVEEGFREIVFSGLKSSSIKRWQTSIFYRRDNCFGI